ncbi:hypothetical protein [Endozoicomonas ascidiicola]|uniref:hypothetical protein n=1 Tax=Endozoicomonas ascidiicola TaxID=1698521 RepID=UPI000831F141|nr:hypothetical protein [Endozoicomonas ascidiicola]
MTATAQLGQSIQNAAKSVAQQISKLPENAGYYAGRAVGAVVATPLTLLADASDALLYTKFKAKSIDSYSIKAAKLGKSIGLGLKRLSQGIAYFTKLPGKVVGFALGRAVGAAAGAVIVGAKKCYGKLTHKEVQHKSINDYSIKAAKVAAKIGGYASNAGFMALSPTILGPVIGAGLLFNFTDSFSKPVRQRKAAENYGTEMKDLTKKPAVVPTASPLEEDDFPAPAKLDLSLSDLKTEIDNHPLPDEGGDDELISSFDPSLSDLEKIMKNYRTPKSGNDDDSTAVPEDTSRETTSASPRQSLTSEASDFELVSIPGSTRSSISGYDLPPESFSRRASTASDGSSFVVVTKGGNEDNVFD